MTGWRACMCTWNSLIPGLWLCGRVYVAANYSALFLTGHFKAKKGPLCLAQANGRRNLLAISVPVSVYQDTTYILLMLRLPRFFLRGARLQIDRHISHRWWRVCEGGGGGHYLGSEELHMQSPWGTWRRLDDRRWTPS